MGSARLHDAKGREKWFEGAVVVQQPAFLSQEQEYEFELRGFSRASLAGEGPAQPGEIEPVKKNLGKIHRRLCREKVAQMRK